jgi:thiamine-phosphate diphosphorylase
MDRSGAAEAVMQRSGLVARLTRTGVYLVTDGALAADELLPRLEAALRAGIQVVQFRTKAASVRGALALGLEVARRCRAHGALFLVNDRADLAFTLEADGIHVGQDDLPPGAARRILGETRLVGLSVSTVAEAGAADLAAEVDYIGFGAMYPTVTKPDAEYAGLDMLREARGRVRKPIVAIGGISAERAAEVIAAGADAVAVVSAIFGADDPSGAARDLLERVGEARESGAA